jgi:cell division protein FtsZ
MFTLDESFDAKAKMKVIGVGGAGGNAVNRMVSAGLSGVDFIAINTDAMALDNNHAAQRLQIGDKVTKGLGAGANPEIGKIAMEEDREKVAAALEGADMVFITAGMGGGTGTGGAPIVAEIARQMDILTVAIVTRPFLFEGKVRDRNAKKGIDDLRKNVDTIIVIPNQKLLSIVDRTTSLLDAFRIADDVLYQATKGISDLISVHGLVNLDFADVKTIMREMGDALMGTGYAEGENRAVTASDNAIHSPLLDDISIVGAKGILINITGGEDMTLYDVNDATQTIYDAVGENVETNIIFGAVTDPAMNGKIRVTVIATGFNEEKLV